MESLERGSADSVFLNFAIAAFSVAISFSASIATATLPSDRVFCVFVLITIVGYLAGLAFGVLWWRSYKSLKKVSEKIRARISPEGEQATDDAAQT